MLQAVLATHSFRVPFRIHTQFLFSCIDITDFHITVILFCRIISLYYGPIQLSKIMYISIVIK